MEANGHSKIAKLPAPFQLVPVLLRESTPNNLFLATWREFGGPDSPSRANGTQCAKIMNRAVKLLTEEVELGSDEKRRNQIVCLLRILINGFRIRPEVLPHNLHNHWLNKSARNLTP